MRPTFIGNTVTMMPKKDPHTGQWARPLEVAGFVAGVCRRWFERAFPDSGGQSMPAGSPRESFTALEERVKPEIHIYDYDNLIDDVRHLFKIKKRS